MRTSTPVPPADTPRPAAANQPIPLPPTNTQAMAIKATAGPPPGQRSRGIEFLSSEGVPVLGSAFVPHDINAVGMPKKYRRNFIEMQQCLPQPAETTTVAPDNTIQHGPDFEERWQVCVRGDDEMPVKMHAGPPARPGDGGGDRASRHVPLETALFTLDCALCPVPCALCLFDADVHPDCLIVTSSLPGRSPQT